MDSIRAIKIYEETKDIILEDHICYDDDGNPYLPYAISDPRSKESLDLVLGIIDLFPEDIFNLFPGSKDGYEFVTKSGREDIYCGILIISDTGWTWVVSDLSVKPRIVKSSGNRVDFENLRDDISKNFLPTIFNKD